MKPKPLVELNHLTVPVVMTNPFIATLEDRHADGAADVIAILKGRFVQGAVPIAQ